MMQQKYELEAKSTLMTLAEWIDTDPKEICSFYEYLLYEVKDFDKLDENYYLESGKKLYNSKEWKVFKNFLKDQIQMRIDAEFLDEVYYDEREEEYIFEWFDGFVNTIAINHIKNILKGDE